jgi:hypothetical protein
MAEDRVFHYTPKCSEAGCNRPAVFKVGAVWSDGSSRELKNYGLACEAHRHSQFERARKHRDGLHLADGESVGPVALFVLEAGRRDTELVLAADTSPGHSQAT